MEQDLDEELRAYLETLYGLIAISVTRRLREFGIRLGATWSSIRNGVLREAAHMVGVGMVIGAVGALAATGLLRSQLFGVDRWIPQRGQPHL